MELRSGSKLSPSVGSVRRGRSREESSAFSLPPSNRIPSPAPAHSTGILPRTNSQTQDDDRIHSKAPQEREPSSCTEPPDQGVSDQSLVGLPPILKGGASMSSRATRTSSKGLYGKSQTRLKPPVARIKERDRSDAHLVEKSSQETSPSSRLREGLPSMRSAFMTINSDLNSEEPSQVSGAIAVGPTSSPPDSMLLHEVSVTSPPIQGRPNEGSTTPIVNIDPAPPAICSEIRHKPDSIEAEHLMTSPLRPIRAPTDGPTVGSPRTAERLMSDESIPCSVPIIACSNQFQPCQYGYSISHIYHETKGKTDERKPRHDLGLVAPLQCPRSARSCGSEPSHCQGGPYQDLPYRSNPVHDAYNAGDHTETGGSDNGGGYLTGGGNGGGYLTGNGGGYLTGNGHGGGYLTSEVCGHQTGDGTGGHQYNKTSGLTQVTFGHISNPSVMSANYLSRHDLHGNGCYDCQGPQGGSGRVVQRSSPNFGVNDPNYDVLHRHHLYESAANAPTVQAHSDIIVSNLHRNQPQQWRLSNEAGDVCNGASGDPATVQGSTFMESRQIPHRRQHRSIKRDGPLDSSPESSHGKGSSATSSPRSTIAGRGERLKRSKGIKPRASSRRYRSSSSSSSSARESSYSSSSSSDEGSRHRHRSDRGGKFYVPAKRSIAGYYSKCPGCHKKPCISRIIDKDFDSAASNAAKAKCKSMFIGYDDERSGTMFCREIDFAMEGHNAVTRYLWAKNNIDAGLWRKLANATEPPVRCHQSYEHHLRRLCRKLRKTFDTDEALSRAEYKFNTCTQRSSETLFQFISRLETLADELVYLRAGPRESTLKRLLYDGLSSNDLKEKVETKVGNHKISYKKFVDRLSEHERRRQGRLQRSSTVNKPSGRSTGRLHVIECEDDPQEETYCHAVGSDALSIKCYRCLQSGHPARLCTEPKVVDLQKRCSKCGNPEHQETDCKVPVNRLFCQRCLKKGHLAYVCTALTPADQPKKVGPKPKKDFGKGKSKKINPPQTPPSNSTVIPSGAGANVIHEDNAYDGLCIEPVTSSDVDVPFRAMASTVPPVSNRSNHRVSMVVGDLCVYGTTRPVLFDTGADISLIALSTLKKLAPNKKITIPPKSSIGRVHVANGGQLDILGKVSLPIGKGTYTVTDTFLLASDHLSTPIIIGCSTMAKLHAVISFKPEGSIEVKIGHTSTTTPQVEPCDLVSPRSVEYIRKVGIMNVMGGRTSRDEDLLSLSAKGTRNLSQSYDLIDTLKAYKSLNSECGIYPQIDDGNLDDSLCVSEETVSSGESLPTINSDDLPPQQAIIREWVADSSAPLGRARPQVPWRSPTSRPRYNYHMARKRGLASIKAITGERMEMFHRALDGYISKGFCAIVKDNRLDPSKPEASTCQSVWEKLSKGTPYQGSLAPLPEHFTARHLVYRDQHPTTPCRIVLDYREANLYSLRGGYPQNSLHGTLLLLRSSKYFIAGDLSKAFCRMQSSRADVPYVGYTCIGPFTVLWSRVGFGTRAAPNMLDSVVDDTIDEIYDLSQLAAEIDGDTFEVAVKSIDPGRIKSVLLYPSEEGYDYLYDGPPIPSHVKMLKFVDDIYALGSTVAEAQRNYRFVSYLLKGHDLPAEDLKNFENWICKSVAGIETRGHLLGYDYLPSNDSLYPTMSAKPPEGLTYMSKRSSSSILASLYDPLGLIIEQDIRARCIWRRICQEIKEWDQMIPYQLQQQVIRWASETTQVCKTISTSRYTPYDAELILSTDASKDAWGADLRLKSRPDVRLAAKGALYTNSTLSWSIPRKELDALYRGLLWTRALSVYLPIKSIYGENQAPLSKLSPEVPIYRLVVAIDSELTVYRLRRPSNDTRLPAPEKRRLQAIRNLCVQLDATVRHIPSGCNPADSVSRYAMGRDFDGHKLSEAIDSASVIYDYREDTSSDEGCQFDKDIYCHVASCIHDPERDLLFSPIPSVTAGCCATLAPPTTANAGCYATLAPPTTANAGCYATLAPNNLLPWVYSVSSPYPLISIVSLFDKKSSFLSRHQLGLLHDPYR